MYSCHFQKNLDLKNAFGFVQYSKAKNSLGSEQVYYPPHCGGLLSWTKRVQEKGFGTHNEARSDIFSNHWREEEMNKSNQMSDRMYNETVKIGKQEGRGGRGQKIPVTWNPIYVLHLLLNY